MGFTIDFLGKEAAEREREREFEFELQKIHARYAIPNMICGIETENIFRLAQKSALLGYKTPNDYVKDLINDK